MDQPNIFEEDKERILNRLDYLIVILKELELIEKRGKVNEISWKSTHEIVKNIENMVKELHA